MKEVQAALQATGIPTFALAWRPTPENPRAPDQYIVYTTMTMEDEHWDDAPRRYMVYVYLNLWSRGDPTDAVASIRAKMRNAGFALVSENDGYEDSTDYFHVAATWLLRKEADADGA